MTRIKHLTISFGLTLALTAAVAAPALAYSTPNAALNAAAEGVEPTAGAYGSPNAILSDRGGVTTEATEISSPNAILGSANVGELATAPAPQGSGGFDWSDALVGAGSATAVLFVMAGVVLLARRRREPTVQPTV